MTNQIFSTKDNSFKIESKIEIYLGIMKIVYTEIVIEIQICWIQKDLIKNFIIRR